MSHWQFDIRLDYIICISTRKYQHLCVTQNSGNHRKHATWLQQGDSREQREFNSSYSTIRSERNRSGFIGFCLWQRGFKFIVSMLMEVYVFKLGQFDQNATYQVKWFIIYFSEPCFKLSVPFLKKVYGFHTGATYTKRCTRWITDSKPPHNADYL